MTKLEQKCLKKCTDNLWLVILIFAFLAGCLLRITMRYFVSVDSLGCYLAWYDEIVATGRIKGIGTQIGDYNVLYQTIISLLSYLPIIPLYLYKGLSICFDLAVSVLVGLFIFDRKGDRNYLAGSLAFSFIWLAPVVALNSSMWAQCDMIYTFFVLLSLYRLQKEKYISSFVLLGFAFAFKLQAILILPFYLFWYFKEKKFSLLHFLIVPAVMWLTTLPGILGGRSLFSGFELYLYQTDEFHWAVVNYPSIWLSLAPNFVPDSYDYIYPVAMVVTVAALAGWMIYALAKKAAFKQDTFLLFALVLTYTTVFFLPSMHERYGFLYEILALVYVFKNKRSAAPCFLLQLISVCTYARYLFGADTSLILLTGLNIIAYVWYCFLFMRELSVSAVPTASKEVLPGTEVK